MHTTPVVGATDDTHVMPDPAPIDDLIDAVTAAEAHALAEHNAGRCHLSEWSCSHCETEDDHVVRGVRGVRDARCATWGERKGVPGELCCPGCEHQTGRVELTVPERAMLLRAWPWPEEAAPTSDGFPDVAKAVERIVAGRMHAAWGVVHRDRFHHGARPEPDSWYAGVTHAERVLERLGADRDEPAAVQDALTPAQVVAMEYDGYLHSDSLDPAWVAGWHAAINHATHALKEASHG